MAEAQRNFYTANGAAAYDVYSYRNQNAQPLQRPQGLPEEIPQPRHETRVRAKTAIAPFTIFGMIAVCCMMVLVIFGYVQLFEASSNVSRLEHQLNQLQQEQTLLRSRYEDRIDLAEVETRAMELGLSKPMPEQIVYVNLSGNDRAEIYEVNKTSFIGEAISAMEESITSLIAYLQPAAA
ncbi:MAG: septum formation initiator family protein [Clostridia bacterium]|nr:septum formation initiator family protein [Clostridia bacterium]